MIERDSEGCEDSIDDGRCESGDVRRGGKAPYEFRKASVKASSTKDGISDSIVAFNTRQAVQTTEMLLLLRERRALKTDATSTTLAKNIESSMQI